MSLALLPANVYSSAYFGGISLPELATFGITDDGDGGDLYLNGLGVVDPTVTGAIDLATIYTSVGLLFRSIPLLRAFRTLYQTPNDAAAELQFQQFLDIKIFPIATFTGNSLSGLPTIGAKAGLPNGPATVPYLHFQRPSGEGGVAGDWHVEVKLRHSITN